MLRLFTILLCSTGLASGATYYVATTGRNTNPGTPAEPFLTISNAVRVAQAGDTIKVGAGGYGEGIKTVRTGSATAPITIDGQNIAMVKYATLSHAYFYIQNFKFFGGTGKGLVYVDRNAHHCIVSNNIMEMNYRPALAAVYWNTPGTRPFGTAGSDNLIISNNMLHGVAEAGGMTIYGDRNVIKGNYCHDADTVDWLRVYGRSNLITGNLFINNKQSGISGHCDWLQVFGPDYGSMGHIIEQNKVINMGRSGAIGQLTQSTDTNIYGFTFRNNLFVDVPEKWSIQVPNVRWYNNTFIRCGSASGHPLLWNHPNCGGGQCINNIFVDCGYRVVTSYPLNKTGWYQFYTGITNVVADYNFVTKNNNQPVYVDSTHRLIGDPLKSNWTAWWETHGVNGGDPLFLDSTNNNYWITGGSPCVNKGTNLTEITTDLDGTIRPQGAAKDIGAYENYNGTFVWVATPAPAARVSVDQMQKLSVSYNLVPGETITAINYEIDGNVIIPGVAPDWVAYYKFDEGPHSIQARMTDNTATTFLSPISIITAIAPEWMDLPCEVATKTIRAYSIAKTNEIYISWPANDVRIQVKLSRRNYTNNPTAWQNWTAIYTNDTTAGVAGFYQDTNVTEGVSYEYRVATLLTNYTCNSETTIPYYYYQHINTGTKIPLREDRGKLILLVEQGVTNALATNITRLTKDIVGSGYKVYRHDVPAVEVGAVGWTNAVWDTKTLIKTDYDTDPTADWTIFIVGHVPVPYSGDSSPGGHTENMGAHPADVFYADMDTSSWTDTATHDNPTWAAQDNFPDDGKFDQSDPPTMPEMRIGRVDFRNLPAFSKSEVELLRQYLERDYAWKHYQFTVRDLGLVNSNNNSGLIYRGEPIESHNLITDQFGTSDNIELGSWLIDSADPTNSYLFAYSYGNGSYARDWQCGYTANFADTNFYAAFVTHYGSYFGDWDSYNLEDAVLWAPLASGGYTLANYYHGLIMNIGTSAIGEPIGNELFAAFADSFAGSSARYVAYGTRSGSPPTDTLHITKPNNYNTLLGDPTLTTRVVPPPRTVLVRSSDGNNILSWNDASEGTNGTTITNILGYYVYRAPKDSWNEFTKLTTDLVTSTTYVDPGAAATPYDYLVRTVQLVESVNRSYYAASVGVFAESGTPPLTIAILTPTNGASYSIDDAVLITTSYLAIDAAITQVDFNVNGLLWSTDTTDPYTALFSTTTEGTYSISATIQDELGNRGTSPAVTITFTNAPPSVSSPRFDLWRFKPQ